MALFFNISLLYLNCKLNRIHAPFTQHLNIFQLIFPVQIPFVCRSIGLLKSLMNLFGFFTEKLCTFAFILINLSICYAFQIINFQQRIVMSRYEQFFLFILNKNLTVSPLLLKRLVLLALHLNSAYDLVDINHSILWTGIHLKFVEKQWQKFLFLHPTFYQIQRSQNSRIIKQAFTLHPGVRVVKLKHVKALFDSNDVSFELKLTFLSCKQKLFLFYWTCESPQIIKSNVNIETFETDVKIKKWVRLKDFNVSHDLCSWGYKDMLGDW